MDVFFNSLNTGHFLGCALASIIGKENNKITIEINEIQNKKQQRILIKPKADF